MLRRIIQGGTIPNLIFYGPSGTGKTTVAEIAAARIHRPFYRLNATTASLADIKAITADVGTLLAPEGVVLYLDEIQYFNKKQQQSLLEFMENGKLTLIASTTENPYFYVYNAVLSRSTVFEFKPLAPEEVLPVVERGIRTLAQHPGGGGALGDWGAGARGPQLCRGCAQGPSMRWRPSLPPMPRTLERLSSPWRKPRWWPSGRPTGMTGMGTVTMTSFRPFRSPSEARTRTQPSITWPGCWRRGISSPPCRRLMVIASEDVGLAHPQAVAVVKACVDSANMLGLPEARIPLAQAAIFLATAPKSNSAFWPWRAPWPTCGPAGAGKCPRTLRDATMVGAANLGHGLGYRLCP